MTNPISGSSAGTLRLNTKASQPRSTSNRSFQDQFRDGLRNGIDMTNSALGRVTRMVPGGAMLSSSLSDAARNLGGPAGLSSPQDLTNAEASTSGENSDGLEKKVEDMHQARYEQQWRIGVITAGWTAKSNILKAWIDSLKGIGSNIR